MVALVFVFEKLNFFNFAEPIAAFEFFLILRNLLQPLISELV